MNGTSASLQAHCGVKHVHVQTLLYFHARAKPETPLCTGLEKNLEKRALSKSDSPLICDLSQFVAVLCNEW